MRDKARRIYDTWVRSLTAMNTLVFEGDPDRLSRPELISLYVNEYYKLDAGLRSRFEAAFKRRNLPLPLMPVEEPPEEPRAAPSRVTIDRPTFLSYLLLIYTGTAIFYSWFYLAERIIKMDFRYNTKNKLIQSGIALVYVVGEILLYGYFSQLSD
jgi:hypothetical protein